MKKLLALCAFVGVAASFNVLADPWKDESGNRGRHHGGFHDGGDYKEEYREGNCKVERKWEGNGEYKEERKCKPPRYGSAVVPVYPRYSEPGIYVEPGIVIQGRAVIR